jgi:hypothetical protein
MVLAAAVAAAGTAAAAVAVGPEGGFLAVREGQIISDGGVVRSLAPGEYAFLSRGGAAFAVVALREGAVPLRSTVRLYDRAGRPLWAVAEAGASSAYVADSGAAALVTMVGDGPSARARLEFYSSTGTKTGEAQIGPPLVADFFPGGERLAVSVLGEETVVYNVAAGELAYRLPAARTLAAGPEGGVVLVDREGLALYRGASREWRKSHGLYFPRLVEVDAAGGRAVVGAHHEVALVSLADGGITARWEAPEDFGVTDLAAASDFSSFAVGVRSLAGVEAVVWLDAGLGEISREEHTVTQPSGASPEVAVFAGPSPRAAAWGQGWHAELSQ